ncbi:hypothetical protein CH380_02415 [Leptospira adleri]|uniref:Uncharacterized protein n=1 Tax=Leptospira adleri TaxID=2023186 RepID=A0A2M9YTP9_9LEPT|nr:hypothetical protein [Leptospira adleri]PJZ54908.1 hypothetical protein CH380_02415 [Leptospira adleri]PJZ59856.1 hypothetical protein CH376_21525 [Leptospira adleri]TGM57089.1 hypothetical protein EHQ97_10780 [Leptospira adleri]
MYFFKKAPFFIPFLFSMCFVFCGPKKHFVRLEKAGKEKGRIYVIRPVETALAMWSYDFILQKYKGHFKNNPELETIASFELENGEFFTEELEEGFYKLSLSSKPGVEKIFKMDKERRNFFRFVIFNEKEISMADFFIKEISETDALGDLLENDHLNEVEKK